MIATGHKNMYPIEYEFKNDSVIVKYNNQAFYFTSYNVKNKARFTAFVNRIKPEQPQDINEIFKVANRYKLKAQAYVWTKQRLGK